MNDLSDCVFDIPASSDECVIDLPASSEEYVIDPPTHNDDVVFVILTIYDVNISQGTPEEGGKH